MVASIGCFIEHHPISRFRPPIYELLGMLSKVGVRVTRGAVQDWGFTIVLRLRLPAIGLRDEMSYVYGLIYANCRHAPSFRPFWPDGSS